MTFQSPKTDIRPRHAVIVGGRLVDLGGAAGLCEVLRIKNVWVNLAKPEDTQ